MNNHPPYVLQFNLNGLAPFAILRGLQAPRASDCVVIEGAVYRVIGVFWIYPSADQMDTPTTVVITVATVNDVNGPIRYE